MPARSVRAFVRYTSRGDYGWLEAADPDVVREIEIFRGDLANPEAVSGAVAGRDVVFHLGALIPIPYSYRHPREFVTANVERHAERARGRAPGRGPASRPHLDERGLRDRTGVPITEEHRLHPQSPYAATKVGCRPARASFQRSFGTPVAIVAALQHLRAASERPGGDPDDRHPGSLPRVVELGATDTTRDFLYVEDTVRG